uniref:NADH-ubiquinone oxidoreductase chain 2 n=1 Tax=Monema flavescens TaxID=1078814 RepID=A0A1L2JGR6_MONFL|nr:NADH dehydrogenase subunit 2 [Monema flavescens]AOV94101.1 NADH dehydrogenase subunit 2 [Monema flavescens]ATO90154.1 NADH dehydrogenase subunit 2 [Monema flavescens]
MFSSLKSNKMFFLFILFFSTLISISANSWFGCWIGLEINLLSFIPLISNSKNLISNEASLKYFLTQSIASINFLFMILLKLMLFNLLSDYIFSIMINSPLLMKMGSAPFHFWFPNIVEGMSWINNFILMTWQKISPMILLSYYFNSNFLILILILNSIIGAIGGLNQTSLRKIMAFSSINNLSWMISSLLISENLWIFYFMFYSFLISIMCFLFNNLNMFFINQLYLLNINSMIKFSFLINFLSLGGLPPFIGFFPKWIIINFLMINKMQIIAFILIMMSLIMLFFYIRISFSSLMFNYLKIKWFKIFLKNKNNNFINLITMISIIGMILSTLFFM